MKIISFDVRGKLAHFRRPDTTATHLSYPFITPTAVKGMVGAILGIEDFTTTDKIGIQLLNPVVTIAQQMSMLGKDGGSSFNRPTTMELLVNPAYRIYYSGDHYTDELETHLTSGTAVYPTFLGSAYALTKPVLHRIDTEAVEVRQSEQAIEISSIVPTCIVKDIVWQHHHHYSRAGGFMWVYKGERKFEKSLDFLYERSGKRVAVQLKEEWKEDVVIVRMGDEHVCLV
ncbi:CRISPR-associated protein Cas5 [Marinicrinis sediminis]|uniref:CRISPR-associated protein Cas5 n=1 Tax=Marinicrinis sediminis TaxID=1652465 RepID=A0ABW5R970_9BACL